MTTVYRLWIEPNGYYTCSSYEAALAKLKRLATKYGWTDPEQGFFNEKGEFDPMGSENEAWGVEEEFLDFEDEDAEN